MQDHTSNFNTEMETIRKNQMKMLEIKSSLREKKDEFD